MARGGFVENGIVIYAEVNSDSTQRPDREELVPVLDRVAAVAA